jgi:Na+/proline symporter
LKTLDWVVLFGTLTAIISYGLYRARGQQTTSQYLLAGRTMPWYAMALSIMATQASAITFISTTGQAYVDGMRFVQYYFGLPLAMILISVTAVPLFHRANVYTAYEYLEKRFDARVRALVSCVFLIQRGLGVGMALYAPAVVLTVILGWSEQWTILLMGCVAILYTVLGGIKAVTWTDFQQMLVMTTGMIIAFGTAITLLPPGVGFTDALRIAGAAGKVNPVTFNFDLNDRYNLFSGLIGGMFLALAYFGCDQSQVQRYLTGKSIAQSRLSLLFNAVAKIPMQFFILLTGIMVFGFYTFTAPPVIFHAEKLAALQGTDGFARIEGEYQQKWQARRQAAEQMLAAETPETIARFREAHAAAEEVRKEAMTVAKATDTNYIFLSFVTRYLPAGVVGLVMAVIFGAAMSVIAGEINSLATVSVIDLYQRFFKPSASDSHMMWASRFLTLFWGLYAVCTAQLGKTFNLSLIEAVNLLGSLFYGGLLGVFVLAFYVKRVQATAAFWGVICGELAIFASARFTSVAFLWWNVIGCVVVIASALIIQAALPPPPHKVRTADPA